MNIILPQHIVFDMDGTLIDISKKYYAAYKDHTRGALLPQSTYWRAKREKKLPPSDKQFITAIESEKYLALDALFPFAESVLKRLIAQKHILHLVSARRNTNIGRKEVERFGITQYFQSIDIGLTGEDVVTSKIAYIQKRIPKGVPFALIGDTEDDINTARKLGGIAIVVSSGVRSAAYLSKYTPDYLIKDIRGVRHLLDFTQEHR